MPLMSTGHLYSVPMYSLLTPSHQMAFEPVSKLTCVSCGVVGPSRTSGTPCSSDSYSADLPSGSRASQFGSPPFCLVSPLS